MSVEYTMESKDATFGIEKKNQSSLKGLLWGNTGVFVSALALCATALTVAAVAGCMFGAAWTQDTSSLMLGAYAVGAIVVDKIVLDVAGGFFTNAIYHLGPEYRLVKLS